MVIWLSNVENKYLECLGCLEFGALVILNKVKDLYWIISIEILHSVNCVQNDKFQRNNNFVKKFIMNKKSITNILIIFVISILITIVFSKSFGSSIWNLKGLMYNVIYGLIIGSSISMSGFLTRFILQKSNIQKYPLRTYIILLISVFLFISIDVIVINALWYRYFHGYEYYKIFTSAGIILSTVITIFIGLTIFFVILSKSFMTRLLDAEKEIQKIKHEADKSKFETLKSQINPHFLFNSLNSLSSLIHIDIDKADEFTNKLSKIYRYILDHQDDELVLLKEEMEFIDQYIYLQSIRFDNNFLVEIEDISKYESRKIIPLSLQLIFENVLKHNVVSERKKIIVSVSIVDDYIIIKNNKNKKSKIAVSHNVGLNNIISRYELVCDKKCIIENSNTDFIVKLPLISEN